MPTKLSKGRIMSSKGKAAPRNIARREALKRMGAAGAVSSHVGREKRSVSRHS